MRTFIFDDFFLMLVIILAKRIFKTLRSYLNQRHEKLFKCLKFKKESRTTSIYINTKLNNVNPNRHYNGHCVNTNDVVYVFYNLIK